MNDPRAEELRHRIFIRRPVRTDDGEGGFAISWQSVANPFAKIEGFSTMRGAENQIDGVQTAAAYYRIIIRYRDGIKPDDQVRWGSIDLNIKAAYDPTGRRRWLWLIADNIGAQATV